MEQEQKRLTKDAIIQELIGLLNQNQQSESAQNVSEMAALIDEMEIKIDAVMEELTAVRRQLNEMQGQKIGKKLRTALLNTMEHMEQGYVNIKQEISQIKAETKNKAAEIVKGVKQVGREALGRVSEFLGLKKHLRNLRTNVNLAICDTDHAIEKIDAFGTGMREAVRKAANTFRIAANKPEKEYGERHFSKTELIKKPFLLKKKLLVHVLHDADAVIGKIENLTKIEKSHAEQDFGKTIEDNMEMLIAEPIFQYGADAFEAQYDGSTEREELVSGIAFGNKSR